MIVYKPVRENLNARSVLRKPCQEILSNLDILDAVPVGQLNQAAAHDVAICAAVTQIVRTAERY